MTGVQTCALPIYSPSRSRSDDIILESQGDRMLRMSTYNTNIEETWLLASHTSTTSPPTTVVTTRSPACWSTWTVSTLLVWAFSSLGIRLWWQWSARWSARMRAMRRAGNRKSSAPPDAAGVRDGVRPIAGKMAIWLDKIAISAMTLDKRLAIDSILKHSRSSTAENM